MGGMAVPAYKLIKYEKENHQSMLFIFGSSVKLLFKKLLKI